MQIHGRNLIGAILDVLAVEMMGSKDFAKLRTGISILGYVASLEDPINMKAFSKLLSFLGHHYPKVYFLLMHDDGYQKQLPRDFDELIFMLDCYSLDESISLGLGFTSEMDFLTRLDLSIEMGTGCLS